MAVEKGALAGRVRAGADRRPPEGWIATDIRMLTVPTPLGIAGGAGHVGTRLGLRVIGDGPHFDHRAPTSRASTSGRREETLGGVGGIGVVGHGSVGRRIYPQVVLSTGHANVHLLGMDKAGFPSARVACHHVVLLPIHHKLARAAPVHRVCAPEKRRVRVHPDLARLLVPVIKHSLCAHHPQIVRRDLCVAPRDRTVERASDPLGRQLLLHRPPHTRCTHRHLVPTSLQRVVLGHVLGNDANRALYRRRVR